MSDVSFDLFVPKSFTVVPTCLGQEPRCCKPSFVEGFCVAESIRKACPIFCSNYTTSTETSSFSQTTGEVDNIFTISSSGHSNETSFQQRESSNWIIENYSFGCSSRYDFTTFFWEYDISLILCFRTPRWAFD